MPSTIVNAVLMAAIGSAIVQADTTPAPAASTLPIIGGVKATVPACQVLHTVVAPAYFTMRKADMTFREFSGNLAKYVESLDGPSQRDAAATSQATLAARSMYLHRMSSDADVMQSEISALQKALDDPRLSKESLDVRVRDQRAQLEQLRDAQTGRLTILRTFIAGEQGYVDTAEAANESNTDSLGGMAHRQASLARPEPGPSAPPTFTGVAVEDQKIFKDWYVGISTYVLAHEDQAVKTLLAVSKDCNVKE